jgi:hypothetical protein
MGSATKTSGFDAGMDKNVFFLCVVETGAGFQSASYPMDTGNSFSGDKADEE